MTSNELHLRHRIDDAPRQVLTNAIVTALARVGGTAAFLTALTAAEAEEAQRARRRALSGMTQEMRA
ncbi:MAG: hypothetical protein ACRYHQ_19125 [Janthinobacterium lividum]